MSTIPMDMSDSGQDERRKKGGGEGRSKVAQEHDCFICVLRLSFLCASARNRLSFHLIQIDPPAHVVSTRLLLPYSVDWRNPRTKES